MSGDCSNGFDFFIDLNYFLWWSGDLVGFGVDGVGEVVCGDVNGEDWWEGLILVDVCGVVIGVDVILVINNFVW